MPINSQEIIIVYIDTSKYQLMVYCLCYCLIKQPTIIDHLQVKMTLCILKKTKPLISKRGYHLTERIWKTIKKIQAENA